LGRSWSLIAFLLLLWIGDYCFHLLSFGLYIKVIGQNNRFDQSRFFVRLFGKTKMGVLLMWLGLKCKCKKIKNERTRSSFCGVRSFFLYDLSHDFGTPMGNYVIFL
jgi:hypothetical protein